MLGVENRTSARPIHDGHALFSGSASEREGKNLGIVFFTLFCFAVIETGLTFLVETAEEKLVVAMFLSFAGLLFSGFAVVWVLACVGYCGMAYLFDNDLMVWIGLESTLIST